MEPGRGNDVEDLDQFAERAQSSPSTCCRGRVIRCRIGLRAIAIDLRGELRGFGEDRDSGFRNGQIPAVNSDP